MQIQKKKRGKVQNKTLKVNRWTNHRRETLGQEPRSYLHTHPPIPSLYKSSTTSIFSDERKSSHFTQHSCLSPQTQWQSHPDSSLSHLPQPPPQRSPPFFPSPQPPYPSPQEEEGHQFQPWRLPVLPPLLLAEWGSIDERAMFQFSLLG